MILADKIIHLRKKAGWSQEELAEKMGVSRQSVSKWEGALSIPDMNRVLKLAEIFNVSTDYLLRDELEEIEQGPASEKEMTEASDEKLVPVSLETANGYLQHCKKSSVPVALGVLLCILSPTLLIVLAAAGEQRLITLTEDQGAMLGLCALILMVVAAVILFVVNGHYGEKYEFLEKEPIDTEYGIDGMVREKMQKYEGRHVLEFALGIAFCVISCIPLFLVAFFAQDDNDFLFAVAVDILLVFVAIGVFLIVQTSIIWEGFQVLLEEGDYTRIAKRQNKRISGIYWGITTAVYLLVSFLSMRWDFTWVIWPVAGVIYWVVTIIYRNQAE